VHNKILPHVKWLETGFGFVIVYILNSYKAQIHLTIALWRIHALYHSLHLILCLLSLLCLHRLSPGSGSQRRRFLGFRVPRLRSWLAGWRPSHTDSSWLQPVAIVYHLAVSVLHWLVPTACRLSISTAALFQSPVYIRFQQFFCKNVSTVASASLAVRTCLQSCCLARSAFFSSAIPAFSRHVTIWMCGNISFLRVKFSTNRWTFTKLGIVVSVTDMWIEFSC
jgi:hypothetical protein